MPSLGEIAAYASLATVIGAGVLLAAGYAWPVAVGALVAGGALIGVVMFAASHSAVPAGRRARPSSPETPAPERSAPLPKEAPAPLPYEAPSELPTRPIAHPRPPHRPARPTSASPPGDEPSTLWPTSSYPPPRTEPEPPPVQQDAPRKPGRRRKR